MGADKILVAICNVLDLYNCSRLVSGVQNIVILQEIVYILFSFSLFLTERFPHQQTRLKVVNFFLQMNRDHYNTLTNIGYIVSIVSWKTR